MTWELPSEATPRQHWQQIWQEMVGKSGKLALLGRGGRRFKSCHPDHRFKSVPRDQLRDLHRVERCTLQQVVARDEQVDAARVAVVLTDPADEDLVPSGGGERCRQLDRLTIRLERGDVL